MDTKKSKLGCRLFGHKYELVQSYSTWIHKIQCTRCQRVFALNDHYPATIIPWDAALEYLVESAEMIKKAVKMPSISQENTFIIKKTDENTLACGPGFSDTPINLITPY